MTPPTRYDIGTLAVGRRTDFGGQILSADDQFIGDTKDRRVRMRRMPVGTDHAGADTPSNLRRGATDTASRTNEQNRLTGTKACHF
jgi:hypothetical protein